MQDVYDKPPVRVEQQPSMGPPLITMNQPARRLPLPAPAPGDMPVWVLPIQRRLDTILRQQDEILYHLQHPWQVRWARWRAAVARFITRF